MQIATCNQKSLTGNRKPKEQEIRKLNFEIQMLQIKIQIKFHIEFQYYLIFQISLSKCPGSPLPIFDL